LNQIAFTLGDPTDTCTFGMLPEDVDCIDIFTDEKVVDAFHQYLKSDFKESPYQAVSHFLTWNRLGDKLSLNNDEIQQKVQRFCVIFNNITSRTLKPTHILQKNQLNEIAVNVENLKARLDSPSPSQVDEEEGLSFGRIAISSEVCAWQETIAPCIQPFPFESSCSQYFRLNIEFFTDDADLCFDLITINGSQSSLLVTAVGINIIEMTHTIQWYGTPPDTAYKVDNVIGIYEVEIPNYFDRFRGTYCLRQPTPPKVLSINEEFEKNLEDPIFIKPESPARFKLLLRNYINHAFNNSLIKFWVETNKGKYYSHLIHIFTK
jgi:hypothetical protein